MESSAKRPLLFCGLWVAIGFVLLGSWAMSRCTPDIEELSREKDIDGLIEALDHRDEVVRENAASALGELGDERAIGALITALKDDDLCVSEDAALSLGKLGATHAVDLLINALERDSPGAARALGLIGDARAVMPLLEAKVDDPRSGFSCSPYSLDEATTFALKAIVDARGAGVMVEALEDENPALRRTAARLLREFDAGFVDEAQNPLLAALLSLLGDEEGSAREDAAWLLGSMGDEQSIEPLIIALKDEEGGVRDTSAWALGMIGDPKAVQPLLEATNQSSSLRAATQDALMAIGKDAVGPLISTLDNPNILIAQEAALALGGIGDPRAVDPWSHVITRHWRQKNGTCPIRA